MSYMLADMLLDVNFKQHHAKYVYWHGVWIMNKTKDEDNLNWNNDMNISNISITN